MGVISSPKPSAWTPLAVLCGSLLLASLLPLGVFTGAIVALLVALLAIELDRSGRYVALRIVTVVAWLLPRAFRPEYTDEWHDHVLVAGEQGVRPVIVAVSIARAAVVMAVRLRSHERAASKVTRGILAVCDAIDADARLVRRWVVTLATPDGPGVYDSTVNAEIEGSDEQDDVREFLERVPGVWFVTGALVSVGPDGNISVIAVGEASDDPSAA